MKPEYFKIGVVVNTQGLHGEIRVIPATDDPSRFDLLDYVHIEKNGKMTRYDIEKVRYHKNFVMLKLRGVDDIEAAEKLRNAFVKIEAALALPCAEDEYYVADLVDMRVVTDDGCELGTISDVISTGANDVYIVKCEGKKDALIPAIKECVLSVDIPENKMTVRLLDGMI